MDQYYEKKNRSFIIVIRVKNANNRQSMNLMNLVTSSYLFYKLIFY